MAILERETGANWVGGWGGGGGVNMHVSCMAVISGQLGSITSLATETTGGGF